LDYASGPGLDFWVDFRRACREVNPESWLFWRGNEASR